MSQITIQCRLVADEATRQFLWALMAGRNTPLINELIGQLSQHEEFEAWRRKGKLSSGVVTQLCKPLKTDSRFSGQPARLYVSAEHTADYIFRSWLAIQKQLQQRLDGKLRWLDMLKSDEELAQKSEVEIAEIRDRASAILVQFQPSTPSDESTQKQSKKGKKSRKLICRTGVWQINSSTNIEIQNVCWSGVRSPTC